MRQSDSEYEKAFFSAYCQGAFHGSMGIALISAARNGFVLLYGVGLERPYGKAKCERYNLEDLLLPAELPHVSLDTEDSAQNAKNQEILQDALSQAYRTAPASVFPAWIHLQTGSNGDTFLNYEPEDLCRAFIASHGLKQHAGKWEMDGAPATLPKVKQAVRRSLSIVRSSKTVDQYVPPVMTALKTMCEDDAPAKKDTISDDAITMALEVRKTELKYNLLTKKAEIQSEEPTNEEDLATTIYCDLLPLYKGVSIPVIERLLAKHTRLNSYHPVLEQLQVTQWDGKDRLLDLYAMIGLQADDSLSRILIRKWLLQGVALQFNEPERPFGADGCLVLIGAEGNGKTSLFRHLAINSAWFLEGGYINEYDKDTARRIVTCWIAELGEINRTTAKSNADSLKAFVTQSVDKYRLPFGHRDVVGPRFTNLCGTCNPDQYLDESTGDRRWWSIPFDRVVPRAELEQFDSLQLWAQIYAIVSPLPYEEKAACFRLTAEEREQLKARNAAHKAPIAAQEEIRDIKSIAARDGLEKVQITVTEFKNAWRGILAKFTTKQISQALTAENVERPPRDKHGRYAKVPVPRDWTKH